MPSLAFVALCLLCALASVKGDAQCQNMASTFTALNLATYNVVYSSLGFCTTVTGPCVLCGETDPGAISSAASNQNYINTYATFFDQHNCWGTNYSLGAGQNVYPLASKKDYIQRVRCAACSASAISCSDAYTLDPCTGTPPSSPSTQCDGALSELGDKKLGVIIAAAFVGGLLVADLYFYLKARAAMKHSPMTPYSSSGSMQMQQM